MFVELLVHGKLYPQAGTKPVTPAASGSRVSRQRKSAAVDALLLPSALLVTMHAQLLAPFVPVDFCLAAFF